MTTPIPADTPLIAEDLLLLLFHKESGTFRAEGSPLFHILAGSVLVELAFQGRVEVDDQTTFLRGRKVHAVAGHPPADPLLLTTWERLARKPTDVHSLILEIGPELRAPMVDRLVEKGHIREESRRFLGLVPTTRLVDGGTTRRAKLLAPVRRVLVDDAEPDARSRTLAALLSASNSLPAMDPEIPWSGAVYIRGREVREGSWGAAAAGEAVTRTMNAVLANNLFVTLTLPALRGN